MTANHPMGKPAFQALVTPRVPPQAEHQAHNAGQRPLVPRASLHDDRIEDERTDSRPPCSGYEGCGDGKHQGMRKNQKGQSDGQHHGPGGHHSMRGTGIHPDGRGHHEQSSQAHGSGKPAELGRRQTQPIRSDDAPEGTRASDNQERSSDHQQKSEFEVGVQVRVQQGGNYYHSGSSVSTPDATRYNLCFDPGKTTGPEIPQHQALMASSRLARIYSTPPAVYS